MSNDCPSLTSPKVLRSAMGCRTAYVIDDIKKEILDLFNGVAQNKIYQYIQDHPDS